MAWKKFDNGIIINPPEEYPELKSKMFKILSKKSLGGHWHVEIPGHLFNHDGEVMQWYLHESQMEPLIQTEFS